MDRFEVSYVYVSLTFNYIYIPVWIDLKNAERDSLNSTIAIYIPVWIDLKERQRTYCYRAIRIYIPVWIDLKCCNL